MFDYLRTVHRPETLRNGAMPCEITSIVQVHMTSVDAPLALFSVGGVVFSDPNAMSFVRWLHANNTVTRLANQNVGSRAATSHTTVFAHDARMSFEEQEPPPEHISPGIKINAQAISSAPLDDDTHLYTPRAIIRFSHMARSMLSLRIEAACAKVSGFIGCMPFAIFKLSHGDGNLFDECFFGLTNNASTPHITSKKKLNAPRLCS